MKSIADELASAQALVAKDDLIIFILNGLGMEFRKISTAIRVREGAISFEELRDKLTNFEQALKQEEIITVAAMIVNNACRGRNPDYQQYKGSNSSKNNPQMSFSSGALNNNNQT
ncbi:hypothetical protein PTKIN_Ptkin06aG0087800 [Pterospermum kingtungense]